MKRKKESRKRQLRGLAKLMHGRYFWPNDFIIARKITYIDYLKKEAEYHGEGSHFDKIYKYVIANTISNPEIQRIINAERNRLDDIKIAKQNANNVVKVKKDNQGVYVGGGGSNRNKIRYPRKNRSLKTWKKFYQMFPYQAELDGWDGKTSSRMKKN